MIREHSGEAMRRSASIWMRKWRWCC